MLMPCATSLARERVPPTHRANRASPALNSTQTHLNSRPKDLTPDLRGVKTPDEELSCPHGELSRSEDPLRHRPLSSWASFWASSRRAGTGSLQRRVCPVRSHFG